MTQYEIGDCTVLTEPREQLLQARHLYLQGQSMETVALAVGMRRDQIDRIAIAEGWHAARQEREQRRFRGAVGALTALARDQGVRIDEIAGSIESVLEDAARDLYQQKGGKRLKQADQLAKTLRTIQEIRRTEAGKATSIEQKNVTNVDIAKDDFHELLAALREHPGQAPKGQRLTPLPDMG